eukprot:15265125-Alexandrium_andersonii.AAC.1
MSFNPLLVRIGCQSEFGRLRLRSTIGRGNSPERAVRAWHGSVAAVRGLCTPHEIASAHGARSL